MSPISNLIINKKTNINPIWIMRQAGRYLPEFREIRKKNTDFIKLCLNPELSKEITLQPLKRFELDAAIIFSDILMLPYGLNQKVEFKKNYGPILSNLDLNIKYQIRDEICSIVKQINTTTILVTYDINDALNISDKILVFKAGVVQQFSNPTTMYCKPANCYCAEILGDINKLSIGKKIFYIRPENIKIVKHSKFSMKVEKCFFQGKDYKIVGSYNNNIWSVLSKEPLKINSDVFFEYSEKDLIYFDKHCSNFFTE